jgi:hyperosmotically inducible protein
LQALIMALAAVPARVRRRAQNTSTIRSYVKGRAAGSRSVTKAREISVETFKGTVQLSGFVTTAQEKDKAGEIARKTKGVVDVKNNIAIK